MKTIRFEDVRFFQDESKRKTVALYEYGAFDAYEDFLNSRSKVLDNETDINQVPEEVLLPNEIRAISTCHVKDTWNSDEGKKRAYFKLLKSYNKMKLRAINRMISRYNIDLKVLSRLSGFYEKKTNSLVKLIKNPDGTNNHENYKS